MVVYKKHMFSKEWYAYAYIDFKRGNTTGRQRIEGKTFDEVALKVKEFIENGL
jgi:hypothetical protein